MEEDNITYLYSRGNCVLYSFFMLWAMFLTILFASDGLIFFGLIFFLEVAFLIFITIKYSIPAIKGKVALEINQQGIIDYTRNIIVEWIDMSDLRMEEIKGIATIHLYFKVANKADDYTRIRLQWVDGSALEIYGIIEANMEERSPRRP